MGRGGDLTMILWSTGDDDNKSFWSSSEMLDTVFDGNDDDVAKFSRPMLDTVVVEIRGGNPPGRCWTPRIVKVNIELK